MKRTQVPDSQTLWKGFESGPYPSTREKKRAGGEGVGVSSEGVVAEKMFVLHGWRRQDQKVGLAFPVRGPSSLTPSSCLIQAG